MPKHPNDNTPNLEPKPSADRPPPSADPKLAREFAIELARLLADDKCENVLVLDVAGLSKLTDVLVIASGSSGRQMASAIQHVEELGEQMNYPPFTKNTDESSDWVLCDFVDVVVHVFEPNMRAHYDLEMMWGDAKEVAWQRPGKDPRP